MSWEMVDEGWGRKAVDFATVAEPSSCREYVFVHSRLGLGRGGPGARRGVRVRAGHRAGAACVVRGASGIDASPRLVAIARFRNPESDIRVGDMSALPWDDASFDVATSFRGIWGTTPEAMAEIRRVLRPGGRFTMTVWGDVSKSPGAWMFAPFRWATTEKVDHQAAMVSLGRPGIGEAFLRDSGFEPEERFVVPVRHGVPRSRDLRAGDRVDGTRLRSDAEHRRGRVPGPRRRPRP